jgi:predicted DNA binding CopG/RHH family protein
METSKEITRPPHFNSEAEEADWWAANPDFVLQELERAKAEGRLGHGTVLRRAAERRAARDVVLELDPGDLAIATQLAERKGLRYQTYLKTLLHDALLREEQNARNEPT